MSHRQRWWSFLTIMSLLSLTGCGGPPSSSTRSATSTISVSPPPTSLWKSIVTPTTPLQGMTWQQTGSTPIALGWSYQSYSLSDPFPALNVLRAIWDHGHWKPDGTLTITNGNYVIDTEARRGPDDTIVLASSWSSGGSDNAGAYVNIVASPKSLMALPTVNVIGPEEHMHFIGLAIRETSATTAVTVSWNHNRWIQKNLGILATIPPRAIRLRWSAVESGTILVQPTSFIRISDNQPVAFIPSKSTLSKHWFILGPFPSVQAGELAAESGSYSAVQAVWGIVAYPPPGLSVWIVGTYSHPNSDNVAEVAPITIIAPGHSPIFQPSSSPSSATTESPSPSGPSPSETTGPSPS